MLESAAVGSSAEAIQVAALAALVGLAAGPEAGLLGSGCPAVLRVLSNLHSLQVQLHFALLTLNGPWSANGPFGRCWSPPQHPAPSNTLQQCVRPAMEAQHPNNSQCTVPNARGMKHG